MIHCRSIIFLVVAVTVVAGKPLNGEQSKRDLPSPQMVEVPNTPDTGIPQESSHVVSAEDQASFSVHPTPSTRTLKNDIDEPHTRVSSLKSAEQSKKRNSAGRKGMKKGKKSNSELLHHLGMTKLRSPVINHHRKRLASQSRKTHSQKNSGDSKMFVIKLPPNPYYYAHHDLPPRPEGVNNLPVDFTTNGKPSRVYHWNIPVLRKMVARKAGSSPKAVFADSDIFNIDKQATWNDTDEDKSLYRKASFYAPKKQSKLAFRKYFAGNGKPHSFYVMDKSKKHSSFHRILP